MSTSPNHRYAASPYPAALELVLTDGTRVPLLGELTIGRAPGNGLQLRGATVSRLHARIDVPEPGAAVLSDAGSTYGSWVDGQRVRAPVQLHDGAVIRLGDEQLVVERPRSDDEAGRTMHVAAADPDAPAAAGPRIRGAYALKRLEAAEGARRWVLRLPEDGRWLRLGDEDAALLELVDGQRDLPELVRGAEQLAGAAGPVRLLELLTELADRGMLDGVDAATGPQKRPGLIGRAIAPRRWAWTGAGDLFAALYAHGGRRLLSPGGLMTLAVLSIGGLMAFAVLVVFRYGTPFVVASHVGLGGIVFLLGRFAGVAVHEAAHGVVLASYGRRAPAAGIKWVLGIPYAYVDTSEAWLEPRRRRIAITAAGPGADLSFGGLSALCCLLAPAGPVRDIFFQLALSGYLGALFNLNPLADRDGYNILVDWLREPGLRRRAREQLIRRLRGDRSATDSRVLARFSAFQLGWTVVGVLLAIGVTLRYEPTLAQVAPVPLVWVGMGTLWAALLAPLVVTVGGPLLARRRARA
jgi:putative peptide zinc metalloprotease protein